MVVKTIVALVLFFTSSAAGQIMSCQGNVNGVSSQSQIQFERTPNTIYVSGIIQNPYAYYTFNGEMFGGNEGFIALVNNRTGERIDRVYIALAGSGFAIRPENSYPYYFDCR